MTESSLSRRIRQHANDLPHTKAIKIHGAYTQVDAEVIQMDMFSAHADQRELLAWIGQCSRPPRSVFVTHGEPVAADTLRRLLRDELGFAASVPEYRDRVELR